MDSRYVVAHLWIVDTWWLIYAWIVDTWWLIYGLWIRGGSFTDSGYVEAYLWIVDTWWLIYGQWIVDIVRGGSFMDSGYVVAHLWTRSGSQVADRGYLGQRGPDLNPAYRTGTK